MSRPLSWNGSAWVPPKWRVGYDHDIPGAAQGWVQQYDSIAGKVLANHGFDADVEGYRAWYSLGIVSKPADLESGSITTISEVTLSLTQNVQLRKDVKPRADMYRPGYRPGIARVRLQVTSQYWTPGSGGTQEVTATVTAGPTTGSGKVSVSSGTGQVPNTGPIGLGWQVLETSAFGIENGKAYGVDIEINGRGAIGNNRWKLWVDSVQIIDPITGSPYVDDGFDGWEPRVWNGAQWI